jgi:4-amino-4-deoxy-L-arabinose transferase-like glycosyltransferase
MSVYESSAPRGGGVTMAAALLAIITVIGIFSRPLLAIDETRYAAVALDMWQHHNWLVPHLNGATYSHKPPVLFWLIVAGWKLFGVSELWARLVAPLAGVVALALISAMARVLWPGDARARGWAPLITVGALVYAAFGSLLMFDTLLACSALLGLLGIVHSVEHGRRRGFWYLAAGIALGVLVKGPVILIHVLPAALLAPWWATPRENRRWMAWYATLFGALVLGVCAALAWAIPAGMAGGAEYQRAIFLGQTVGRMSKSFAHRRAVWWYLPLLPVVLFPWFAWPESWRALRALRVAPRDAGSRFCVAWAVCGLIAFSLVSGKQLHYLVPLAPAMALLLARGLSQREAAPLTRPWPVAAVIAAFAMAVILAGTTTLASRAVWWPHAPMAWGWALLPLGVAITLLVWQRGRITRNAAVHALAASTAALLCGVQLSAGRVATIPYNTGPMATTVERALADGHAIAMVGKYNGEYHFPARLQNVRIDEIEERQIGGWIAAHDDGMLLRYERGRDAPQRAGIVAQYPFRNGWVTLSTAALAGRTTPPKPDPIE